MTAAFLLFLLLIAAPGRLSGQTETGQPGMQAQSILTAVSSFAPRQEGSPAEGELLDWIGSRLAEMGMHAVPFDFSRSDFEHSFSRCLRVDVPGRSRDSLILAVPIDAPPEAHPGEDGSINVALALDLLGHVKGTTPPLSLVVLFLGAEYGDTDAYPMGSTLFLRDYQPDYRAAVVYLNLRGIPDRILVRGGGRGIVSPFWLMSRCVSSLRAARVPYRLQADEVQAFRLGATEEKTLIEPYLRAGYPSIGLEGESGAPAAHATPGMLPFLSTFLRGFLEAGGGIPEEWDRHYLLVQAGDLSLIVGEKAYVAMLGGTVAAVLLFALLFVRRLKKYVRSLVRNVGAVLPLAGLTFLFLVTGTYALRGILALRAFPGLWRYAPFEFLGLKICVALFLYAALYNPFRRLPFPRKGSFYSAAALFFLLVEIAVVAVFDISFTSYFLWAFLLVFFSTLARNRWVKLALVLPAPFWGIRGIIKIFLVPALPFCRILTLSPGLGNLMVAGAALPFILVLLRLGLAFPGKGLLRRGIRELLLAGVFLAVGGLIALHLAIFSPFSPVSPQPVTAIQTVVVDASGLTSSTSLALESPAPVSGISLTTPGGSRPLPSRWPGGSLTLPRVASPVRVSVDAGQFLQQQTVVLDVKMPSRPRSFGVSIESPDDFVLFDSSFPAVRVGPRSYRLLVGAFPPDPLFLQLSLPIERAFRITLTAEFDSPLIAVDVKGRPDMRVATRVRVVRTLELRT